jgi:urease accessory protein
MQSIGYGEAPGGGILATILQAGPLPSPPPQAGEGTGSAAKSEQIFAANRAVGSLSFEVKNVAGKTRRGRLHEAGSLRVRCPGAPAAELEAVLINTAGGVAGGDRFTLDITAGDDTRLVITTAAAEKVYRTLGPDSTIDVKLNVASGATLAWLPQETILFDRARLARTIEADVAADARLVIAEAVVFGRSGMGETVEEGALIDRWRIRRAGKLVYAETVRLDGAVASVMAQPAVAKGGVAVATVLIVPGDDAVVAAVRALQDFSGEVGASAWKGIAAVRLAAPDGAALRRDLIHVMTTVRALPRIWTN